MPLPATEPVPLADEPAAATPANAVGLDNDRDVVPEMAPANGIVEVAVEGAASGATARGVCKIAPAVVESFF